LVDGEAVAVVGAADNDDAAVVVDIDVADLKMVMPGLSFVSSQLGSLRRMHQFLTVTQL
jgi:hypothetical protein